MVGKSRRETRNSGGQSFSVVLRIDCTHLIDHISRICNGWMLGWSKWVFCVYAAKEELA